MSSSVWAQTNNDTLANCLNTHTSAQDRKTLSVWVFVTLANHPDLKDYASSQAAKDSQRIQADMAKLLTRLITDNCAKQTRQTLRDGGTASIQKALTAYARQSLGELVGHPNVTSSLGGLVSNIEPSKWARMLLMP
jgi:hypothetical protein